MPDVSLVGTLIATVLSFVLGALWYGPFFGTRWMQLVGTTQEQLAQGFNPRKTYGITFVLAFLGSYAIGWGVGSEATVRQGLLCGVVVGLFWVTTSLITNDLFERRPASLTAINCGYHVVRFTLAGLVFGLLG